MNHVVRPIKTTFQSTEWLRSCISFTNIGCSGCISAFVAVGLLLLAYQTGIFAKTSFGDGFLRFAAVSALIYLAITIILYVSRKTKLSRAEASKSTSDALLIMKGIKEHSEYLTYKAHEAAQALKSAAYELKEEAFAPFWDEIENSANALGYCHASCQWLSAGAPRYDEILRGRDHNFPDCFEGIDTLPDCQPLLEEFYRLVRQAQKDFRFANIWEHRQTRKVLVAGFATLGEAIRNLEATVVRSMAELRRTIALQALATNKVTRVALRLILPFP